MCIMAFGIGSNDAANSWATSVGSGAITLKTALILGAICEFSGTVLLGSGVAKTIKEDISDIENEDCWYVLKECNHSSGLASDVCYISAYSIVVI
jgi:phosphate/sulfate permease